MIILPAIDIQDGQCVRLVQGDYHTAHQVAEDPLKTALGFQSEGAEWLHMVDLDGAKEQKISNQDVFLLVAQETDLKIELGGGIRDLHSIEFYLSHGISRVILGSAALKNPPLVREAVRTFGGEAIAVGIDARQGYVATEGWLDTSDVYYLELARKMEDVGVKTIIFTDIAKDGTLQGPNLTELQALQEAVSCQIIASGGISGPEDIRALRRLNLYGAICGKALYAGRLTVSQAIREGA